MKNLNSIVLSITFLTVVIVLSAFTACKTETQTKETQNQTMNIFVSHEHCITPFTGKVNNFDLELTKRTDQGNPIENMKISFEIDPETFIVCSGEELTNSIKTPGLFIGENNEKITFKTTNTYTVGIDWYQLNGLLSIRGTEKEVQFFVSGIRNPEDTWATHLVLDCKIDLFDWGIDSNEIVSDNSDSIPNKWMQFNMKIDMNPWITISPETIN